ncbi:hypothetical protein GTO87_09105 [Ligilactobacillus saerimneri]|uniref:Uncharacterized protein n=1 Tax=Ligilactobacillus saerimneri TaxID=228229 RepID=A0A7H9ELW9_9LACO|nr:hypothetical protein [Ligilactobacillus saerimneri]QLL78728.1 hypothetical protein GTO87_09105 [Ligilactobacillus saerimneri]
MIIAVAKYVRTKGIWGRLSEAAVEPVLTLYLDYLKVSGFRTVVTSLEDITSFIMGLEEENAGTICDILKYLHEFLMRVGLIRKVDADAIKKRLMKIELCLGGVIMKIQ